MNWALVFVLTALTIYIIYNIVSLSMFGIPSSLSETFYLFKEKKEWMKYLFPIMMVSLVVFLMPAWLEITAESNLQFATFLATCGILFTAAAPHFKSGGTETKVHFISAISAAVFAIIWTLLAGNILALISWILIMIFLIIRGNTTDLIKNKLVYILETTAFMSTFTSIIIYYFS